MGTRMRELRAVVASSSTGLLAALWAGAAGPKNRQKALMAKNFAGEPHRGMGPAWPAARLKHGPNGEYTKKEYRTI